METAIVSGPFSLICWYCGHQAVANTFQTVFVDGREAQVLHKNVCIAHMPKPKAS